MTRTTEANRGAEPVNIQNKDDKPLIVYSRDPVRQTTLEPGESAVFSCITLLKEGGEEEAVWVRSG